MSGTLWQVKALVNHAQVVSGMEVEILIKGRTGKPSQKEIMEALDIKYEIKAPSGLNMNIFQFTK